MPPSLHLTQVRLREELAAKITMAFYKNSHLPLTPPVPISFLAQASFGLRYEMRRISWTKDYAAAQLDLDRACILVDDRSTMTRRRFAIAHELAHWILHRTVTNGANGLLPIWSSVRARNEERAIQFRGQEANEFAAALLLPADWLHSCASTFRVIDQTAIWSLAEQFQVSPTVVALRLQALSTYLLWSGPSIDWQSLEHYLYGGGEWEYGEKAGEDPTWTPGYMWRPKEARKVPFIIEFSGTSNAGKDTQIDIVHDLLQDSHGLKGRIVNEAIHESLGDKSLQVDRLLQTVAQTVVHLFQARFENPGNCDYIILNRGPFDRLSMLLAAQAMGAIPADRTDTHLDYLLSYAHMVDLVVLFQISPEESLRREWCSKRQFVLQLAQSHGRTLRDQRLLNLTALTTLNQAYQDAYERFASYFGDLRQIGPVVADSESVGARALELGRVIASTIVPKCQEQQARTKRCSSRRTAGSLTDRGSKCGRAQVAAGAQLALWGETPRG